MSPPIAAGDHTARLVKLTDAYIDALAEAFLEHRGAAGDEKVRAATIGAAAGTVLVSRLADRFGALAAWSGLGQGLGSAFAQMAGDAERIAAKTVLEESIALGFRDLVAATAPVSTWRQ